MGSFSQSQWPGWAYTSPTSQYPRYAQMPSYAAYLPESMELYSAHQSHLIHHQQMSRTTETKPRLSKEEVELLEAEFQKNHKPNSSTKKALAESMRVDHARINNWFQNRRAREKKENNIREYAARQKLEKETAAMEAGSVLGSDRQGDRVASSAPFPNASAPAKASGNVSSPSTDRATPGRDSEAAESSQSDDPGTCSSPDASINGTPDHFQTFGKVDYFSAMPPHANGLPMTALEEYPRLVIPNDDGEATPSYSQQCFGSSVGVPATVVQGLLPQYQGVDGAGMRSSSPPKSPSSMGIASRRNRRPPHLAIGASRSYSGSGPKTGFDLGRRADVSQSMRRVASATGPVRISKPSGTPRSPYFDRGADALLQLNRSPSFTHATATVAPPTPNTPLVSNTQGAGDASLDEKLASDLAVQDPTLRTPPTTPGLIDNMFAVNSSYGIAVGEEPLVTPGLGFSGDFEVPGQVPNYVANSCSSQPQTPLYSAQMGPNYFGYSGGNAEYNWSDAASSSARSSPGQHPRNVQFMNMTPSSFTHVEK